MTQPPNDKKLHQQLLEVAKREHKERKGQDVREYASFVPIDAKIVVKKWPKL